MERCEDCSWRKDGYCTNQEKIYEGEFHDGPDADDTLVYDYFEGGGFAVGPKFGCVHFLRAVKE